MLQKSTISISSVHVKYSKFLLSTFFISPSFTISTSIIIYRFQFRYSCNVVTIYIQPQSRKQPSSRKQLPSRVKYSRITVDREDFDIDLNTRPKRTDSWQTPKIYFAIALMFFETFTMIHILLKNVYVLLSCTKSKFYYCKNGY